MRLGHIAIVTADLDRTKTLYETLGLVAGDVHDVVEQYPEERAPHRYRGVALKYSEGRSSVWLMEPVGDVGPLARFLGTRGTGFHHLGLKTDDIAGVVRRLKREGMTFLREPHAFPRDREIRALLSPRECDGVLIEIVQRGEAE